MTDGPFTAPPTHQPWRPGLGLALLLAVVVSVVPDVGLMAWRIRDLDHVVREVVSTFDANYDPIVITGGRVTVEGDRLVDLNEGHDRFLVDPDETISDDVLARTGRYIVLRSDVLVDNRPFQRREYQIHDLQEFVGVDPLRIDGTTLGSWWDTAGYWYFTGVMLLVGATAAALVFAGLVLQALFVGPLLRSLKGGGGLLRDAFAAALLASLGPQVLMFVVRQALFDPGFVLRSGVILMGTLPIAWRLMPATPSGGSGADARPAPPSGY